jgi:catechol 2,3-dioxygenase-like lactoylglutathione lyase family enzyme
MSTVLLTLLVLKTHDLDRLRRFYEALGLHFSPERHGAGPAHLAARVGETVLELYPLSGDAPADATTRLGFCLADLDAALARLSALAAEAPRAPASPPGRVVVRDPDGRAVELSGRRHA